MSTGTFVFKKIFRLCTLNTSLHSGDQEELFLTAKKIGKDLSVILKHETFQRSIVSLEKSHSKDVLKDVTS